MLATRAAWMQPGARITVRQGRERGGKGGGGKGGGGKGGGGKGGGGKGGSLRRLRVHPSSSPHVAYVFGCEARLEQVAARSP